VFSKIFELLIIDHIRQQCVMLPFQFGFQPHLGCNHALRSLCTILKDTERLDSPLAIGAYDISNAFGSQIHSQAMHELLKSGISVDLVRPLYCMYRHLCVRLKIGSSLLPSELRVNIGIKQRVIISPTIYNNATLRALGDLSPCCIFNGVSVSVLCYADDVLNLSRTVFNLEKSFREIAKNYNEIGLSLNAAKSRVII
jgi:hypothetical protein